MLPPPSPPRSRVAARVAAEGYAHASGRLFWGGVKEFADGSLGSCTALMHEPYLACGADGSVDPHQPPVEAGGTGGGETGGVAAGRGIRMIDVTELQGLVEDADRAGLQVRSCWVEQA